MIKNKKLYINFILKKKKKNRLKIFQITKQIFILQNSIK